MANTTLNDNKNNNSIYLFFKYFIVCIAKFELASTAENDMKFSIAFTSTATRKEE